MVEYIALALVMTASTYGYSEQNCGDSGSPVDCSKGATTSSGEAFHPDTIPTAAVPAPVKQRTRPMFVKIKAMNGSCVTIRVNDKSNERFIGKRGLDLTPAALSALGIKPDRNWSGVLTECEK